MSGGLDVNFEHLNVINGFINASRVVLQDVALQSNGGEEEGLVAVRGAEGTRVALDLLRNTCKS